MSFVKPFFKWYDLWVGIYWDRRARVLHVCPVPMFGFSIQLPPAVWKTVDGTNGKIRAYDYNAWNEARLNGRV